jgi:hypothetical protein
LQTTMQLASHIESSTSCIGHTCNFSIRRAHAGGVDQQHPRGAPWAATLSLSARANRAGGSSVLSVMSAGEPQGWPPPSARATSGIWLLLWFVILKLPEPRAALETRRPKISASRSKYVQPSELLRPPPGPSPRRPLPAPTHAKNSNLPAAPCTNRRPHSQPDGPNLGIQIKICATSMCVRFDHLKFPCLASEFVQFLAF